MVNPLFVLKFSIKYIVEIWLIICCVILYVSSGVSMLDWIKLGRWDVEEIVWSLTNKELIILWHVYWCMHQVAIKNIFFICFTTQVPNQNSDDCITSKSKFENNSKCFMAGSICNCILPEALKISAIRNDTNYQPYDSEKRSLRSSAFSCMSSISMRQKQLSTSSLLPQSPLKGCLPPWELRRSNNGSLKEQWTHAEKVQWEMRETL